MIILEIVAVAILLPLFVSAVYAGSVIGVACALILTSGEAFTLKQDISNLYSLHKLSKSINDLVESGFELQDSLDAKLKELEITYDEQEHDTTEKSINVTKNQDKIKKYFNEKENNKSNKKKIEDDTTYVVIE